jgi:potassium-transporting ATPase KdpC subunit
MHTLRRQLVPAIGLTIAFIILCCVAYPAATWVVGDLAFHSKITGSFVKVNGKVVGSSLIGQNFTDAAGNPLPQYFQPRPSDTYTSSYNPAAGSSASNLGPSNPLLVGFIPGVNTVRANGSSFPRGVKQTNPFATKADPYCVPMSAPTKSTPSAPVVDPTAGEKFAMAKGTYVCDANTVPERAIAYRAFNGLAANAKVPVDAVTASASGLDPDISPANAAAQASRVAKARHLPQAQVDKLISEHTAGRQLGFLGEKAVNVLQLNVALDKLKST